MEKNSDNFRNCKKQVHDSKAAFLLMRVLKDLCFSLKVIIADGGCRGELARQI